MKTLHFISLNNCFVSTHVAVRFTHAYWDFVVDNDYVFLFKSQVYSNATPENDDDDDDELEFNDASTLLGH